jgi:hypothetical protein
MGTAKFRDVVAKSVAAVLGPLGFRKRGYVFFRNLETVIHLISIQSSVSSTSDTARMTVNLAVVCPSLLEPGRNPSVMESHWNERLGTLMPQAVDVWWTMSTPEETATAATEIAQAIQEFGVPALDEIRRSSDLFDVWRSGKSPGLTRKQREDYLSELGSRST